MSCQVVLFLRILRNGAWESFSNIHLAVGCATVYIITKALLTSSVMGYCFADLGMIMQGILVAGPDVCECGGR